MARPELGAGLRDTADRPAKQQYDQEHGNGDEDDALVTGRDVAKTAAAIMLSTEAMPHRWHYAVSAEADHIPSEARSASRSVLHGDFYRAAMLRGFTGGIVRAGPAKRDI